MLCCTARGSALWGLFRGQSFGKEPEKRVEGVGLDLIPKSLHFPGATRESSIRACRWDLEASQFRI